MSVQTLLTACQRRGNKHIAKRILSLLICVAVVGCGSVASAPRNANKDTNTTMQERQCISRGWRNVELPVANMQRELLWKGPAGAWTKGAILVMHGGGGKHNNWCVANVPLIEPQVRFTELALAEGFAVFLLNSSDSITDSEGRLCGKIWDDEVRARANIDLPFIEKVIRELIPKLRPADSQKEIFMTGLSSGGYMTVRAATRFDNLISAFVPVSSGDPYGWHRVCEAGLSRRSNVQGVGFDNETNKQIIQEGACRANSYPNEKPWESTHPPVKPTFRLFHHENDGINDASCGDKVAKLLVQHGYPEAPAFRLRGGSREPANHFWQDAYNRPILEFFSSQVVEK